MAEPWLKIINPPNRTKTNSIGNIQYFFLTFKNSQNSFKKLIFKMLIIFVAIIIIIIFNIMIHYQGKQIYNFHNCLNLIKHIKKY